jgi:hypothetical protein
MVNISNNGHYLLILSGVGGSLKKEGFEMSKSRIESIDWIKDDFDSNVYCSELN